MKIQFLVQNDDTTMPDPLVDKAMRVAQDICKIVNRDDVPDGVLLKSLGMVLAMGASNCDMTEREFLEFTKDCWRFVELKSKVMKVQ